MEFTCEKSNLLSALTAVARICSSKATLPVLAGIHLSVRGGQLTLTATDLEIGVESYLPVKEGKDGEVVLPGKSLTDLIRKLPEGEVTFTEEDKTVIKVTSNGSEYILHGMPPEEFPPLPKIDEQNKYNLPQKDMKLLIKQSIFAAANDDSRPIFTGCLVEVEDGSIRLVASDTHRLALREARLEAEGSPLRVVVPAKAVNEVARLCSNEDDRIEFACEANQIMFKVDGFTFISRLIDGNFPDYRRVIPDSYQTKVIIDRKTMLEAIERISLFAPSSNNAVRLNFNGEGLTATAAGEGGRAKELVACEVEGPETSITFNYRYLIEGLRAIEGEKVEIQMSGSLNPAVFRDTEDPAFLYLLLPIRTA
ncbi:MAG: polymerase subunit beta [Eubacteriales bacterium]|nr:polymerase subunit beta [Eubacteriales bacterium]MDN5363574.1 polymerase subunit beta [Eubacteriales bacterium]